MTTTTIKAGDIVLPQGDPAERIVGIVTDANYQGDMLDMVDVVWISDTRGIFYCWEAIGDVTLASLSERAEITDVKLDHLVIARLLDKAAAARRADR